ncbi:MAG: right-handed parallel beta-helix repeat-containing protein, partial [Candidatus Melainabacteria bacterium]|nr:right-handed parallel beta-helix repeat-containing protein [Candidatus Melainabacteria bacterium]
IYGYNAGSIHNKLRDSHFVEEHGGKTKAKKGARNMTSFDFANSICKPNMDLFSSFIYAYGALHGFGHADLSFHDNSRLNCLSPIPRDVSTGLYSPYFKGDQGNQNPSFALSLAFFDLLAPQWRPDIVGRSESFLLHKANGFEADLSYHHFAHMPATLRYYYKQKNVDDLIDYAKYWAGSVSRGNLKRRVENFSYALGEVAKELSPDQKQMPRVVAYHLRNALQLADTHPKNLISSKASVGSQYLKKIIESVSGQEIKVRDWELRALASRNQIVESLGLPAAGLDLSQAGSVISFLYRRELDDELQVVFLERGPKLANGNFELVERGGKEAIKPSKVLDLGAKAYPIDKKSLALAQIKPAEKLRAYYFKIPKADDYRYLGYHLSGDKQVWASREFVAGPKIEPVDRSYTKEKLAKFFDIAGRTLSIKAKPPVVEGSLEIPQGYNLVVNQDTKLEFATNGCMMVYGTIKTNPQASLELAPVAAGWSGIHFLNNQDLNLRNIKISSIGDSSYGVKCGGRDFSGGVSFFDTKVELENVQVLNSNVEDAMHFLRSELVMKNSLVSGAQSDAIDADFSNLQINNSKLEGSKGDGLDLSGSLALLKGLESINQTDKGLSVGENSNIFVFDSKFSSKEYCIAIKDSSRLYLDLATELVECKTPVGEYIKKPYFTKPSLLKI